MTLLLGMAIRSSLMLVTGLAFRALLAKHSAALRHRVLVASLAAAVIVTPVSLVLPAWRLSLPARLVDPAPASPTTHADPLQEAGPRRATVSGEPDLRVPPRLAAPARVNTTLAIVGGWLIGALVAACLLIASLLRVRHVAARAVLVDDPRWLDVLKIVRTTYGMTREVVISRTESTDVLGTWGLVKPEVLLPRESQDWTRERMHVVLSHELAHVRRHDWPVQIGAELIRAILWFNPLVWLVCRRLRDESERACDDEVLGTGVEAREYAANLLELARQCRRPGSTWASAIPMAHLSTLEGRITAMLNPLLDRRTPSGRTLGFLAVVLLAVMLPVAAARARQVGPTPVSGTIYDATGAVIPGAQVALVDANDGKWTATSNARGRFELPPVGPGKFLLEVTLPGFRALRQEFELRDADDWDRAVTLQIGSLSETVAISASRAMLPKTIKPISAESQPVRVGGNVRVPKKEVHVAPIYPESMLAAGLSGVVPVEAVIGVDGTVSVVRVLSAQVHPDFAIAAVDAVRQWRFTPTLLNRVPVEVTMTVTLRFSLAD